MYNILFLFKTCVITLSKAKFLNKYKFYTENINIFKKTCQTNWNFTVKKYYIKTKLSVFKTFEKKVTVYLLF